MATNKPIELAKILKHIIAVGDVHGKYPELGFRIRQRYKVRDSIICCAGDIGLGFEKKGYYLSEFEKLNRICMRTNNIVFFVRGNHDDPEYFNGALAEDINIFSNIRLVADYELLETGVGNILFVGGATSIDRTCRHKNISYWENEAAVYDPEKIDAITKSVDIVITHTSPKFCEPKTKTGIMGWFQYDYKLVDDCTNERQTLTDIHDHLIKNGHTPKYWCNGHFHFSRREKIGNTTFVVCDELEFYELLALHEDESESTNNGSVNA